MRTPTIVALVVTSAMILSCATVGNPGRTSPTVVTAADGGALRLVSDELARGVPVDTVDQFGNTAMLLATDQGHRDVVAILLEYGADPDRANDIRATPLQLASEKGFSDIVRMLVDAGPM